MIHTPEVHRLADGTIDFDFYRRRAARQRQFKRRAVARHYLTLFLRMMNLRSHTAMLIEAARGALRRPAQAGATRAV